MKKVLHDGYHCLLPLSCFVQGCFNDVVFMGLKFIFNLLSRKILSGCFAKQQYLSINIHKCSVVIGTDEGEQIYQDFLKQNKKGLRKYCTF